MRFESIAQDISYSARTLRRSYGFTIVAVLVLALGIGATTAVVSLANAVMLRPLPFIEPDRLVVLWSDISRIGGSTRSETTLPNYVAWKESASSFEDMAALRPVTYNMTGEGEPVRLEGIRATTNLFSLLGMQPILGRTFLVDDEGPQASPVAVVSEDLWLSLFGGEPNIISRPIVLDGLSHTIIGVVPTDFRFPNSDVSVWVPAAFSAEELAEPGAFSHYVVARLQRDTTLSEAQAEMTTIASSLHEQFGGPELGVTVAQLQPELSRGAGPMLVMLLAAVGAVLLITCANVANLLLARSTDRQRELSLRKALGASDGRMLRQLLTESAVLACLGVVIGIALSTLSFDYLARLMPGNFPDGAVPTLDWRVLSFTGGIALLTVLLVGSGPALAASRLDVNETLKKGSGAVGLGRGSRMRNTLVVGEIAITAALLVAAGLLLRSYAEVLNVDPGFRTENILVTETVLSPSQYSEPGVASGFFERVLERVNALPGVSSAAYVDIAPLLGRGRSLIMIEDRAPLPPGEGYRMIISDRVVSPGYLSTLGAALIQGRYLGTQDSADAPLSVVINEALARAHWPDEDPIGARFTIGPPGEPPFTVVGIVSDIRQSGLDVPPEPEMYTPFAQRAGNPNNWPRHLLVHTQGDSMALAASVRNAVWEVDANQPVSILGTMSDVLDAELANRDMQLTLVGGFAVAALLLASVGLYGVLSYTIARRTPEIGLRIALGAHRRAVIGAVLRNALFLTVIGILLGLSAALGFGRLLGSFLFAVEPADPSTFAVVSVLLLLVAILAGYLPARRAASVDPMAALRAD